MTAKLRTPAPIAVLVAGRGMLIELADAMARVLFPARPAPRTLDGPQPAPARS